MSAKPCKSCRHYKHRFLMAPVCVHPSSIERGFEHYDVVSGETRKWEDTPMVCYKARFPMAACGPSGHLWERQT